MSDVLSQEGLRALIYPLLLEDHRAVENSHAALRKQVEAAEAKVTALRDALEADVTDLWQVTNAIKAAIDARDWITQGRGPYAWDDDRYKEEAGRAFQDILALILDTQILAGNRFHEALKESS